MKYPFHCIVFVCLIIAGLTSEAHSRGGRTGNGGGGWVSHENGVLTTELLDFWEARTLRGLRIHESEDIEYLLQRGVLNLEKANPSGDFAANVHYTSVRLWKTVDHLGLGLLPEGVGIAPPPDSLHRFTKIGATLEGIALYDDDYGLLDVHEANYRGLSRTGRAGLFFHEGVYEYLRRRFRVMDSVAARAITGCAMAEDPCPELSPNFEIPTEGPLYECAVEAREWGVTSDETENGYVDASAPKFLIFPRPDASAPKLDFAPGSLESSFSYHWRFQLVALGEVPPPARAYFDLLLHYFLIDAEGYLLTSANRERNQTTIRTRSSEDRWRDIGVSFTYRWSREETVGNEERAKRSLLNGRKLRCQQLRR